MRTAWASSLRRLGASLLAVMLCAVLVSPAQAITSNTHFASAVPVTEKTAYTGVLVVIVEPCTGLFAQGDPVNGCDPLGRWDNTDFGNRVQEVITDDFIASGGPGIRDGNLALGTMVGVPSVGALRLRPDLFQLDGKDNYFYEIKSATPSQMAEGIRKVALYNSYLNYYGPWRPGSSLDYTFWRSSGGPVISTDRSGNPLPGGCIAVVLPPAGGLMLYLKINPKLVPKTFVDFIVADVAAFSQFSTEASVAAELTELTSVATTVSTMATTATASTGAGMAMTVTINAEVGIAAETSLMGAP